MKIKTKRPSNKNTYVSHPDLENHRSRQLVKNYVKNNIEWSYLKKRKEIPVGL